MQDTQDTAVIILNWNGEKWLRRFLGAVVANTDAATARVIVADNGSTDGSLQYVRETFGDTVGVIVFDENYGFAGGYNRAIGRTRYRYTVLLNSDVEPAPGWLGPLHDYMLAHPDTAAVQPKILSYDRRDRFEYAGASGGYLDRYGYPYCRGRIFGTCEEDRGQYDTGAEVFWASGAALMVDTERYLAAGGLDEQFFAHQEEIDLCWRLQLDGARVAVVPQSVVYHVGGGSLPPSDPRKVYLNFRNSLLMLHKNLPDTSRRRTLFRRRLLDTIAWGRAVVMLHWREAAAILRAHNDFRRMARSYTRHPDRDLLHAVRRPNIITEYFVRGHRTFDSLKN